MPDNRGFSTVAAAALGGVVAAAIVWRNRPDPQSCMTLENGMRTCMPIHVVDPPLWLYMIAAAIGALLAGGVVYGYTFARRSRAR